MIFHAGVMPLQELLDELDMLSGRLYKLVFRTIPAKDGQQKVKFKLWLFN